MHPCTRKEAPSSRFLGARSFAVLGLVLPLFFSGCGGGGEASPDGSASSSPQATQAGGAELTAWQLENGLGPITTDIVLGAVDAARAQRGEEVFNLKCSACHKLDERYIGPPLGDVLTRRTPAFVLNMMLNSWEMTQKHPTVREMLATYYTPMTDQGLTEEDAYALLDYLRNAPPAVPPGTP